MATKRKTFRLTFKMDNAAFDPDWGVEAARILSVVSDQLECNSSGNIRDVNGNHVGTWRADT